MTRNRTTRGDVVTVAVLGAVLIGAVGCGKWSGTPPADQNAVQPGPIVLDGRVTDPTGKPLSGARVFAVKEYGLPLGADFDIERFFSSAVSSESPVCEVKTAEDGTYAFDGNALLAGTYCVYAQAGGQATAMAHFIEIASTSRAAVDLVLERPAFVEGKVLGPEGKPVSGATVVAAQNPSQEALSSGKFAFDKLWTTTSAKGGFRFESLNAEKGSVNLFVWKEGLPITLRERISVPAAEPVEVRLWNGFDLKGKVTSSSTKKPLAGAEVMALGDDGGGFGKSVTGADGAYAIKNLHPGRYHVIVGAPEHLGLSDRFKVAEGAGAQTFDAALEPGVIVEGEVVDPAGKPVQGAVVAAMGLGELAMFGGGMVSATSGEDGAFTLRYPHVEKETGWKNGKEVETGKRFCNIVVYKAGWRTEDRRPRIEVNAGQTELKGAKLTVVPLTQVSGKVVDAKGKPVAGAELIDLERSRMEQMVLLSTGGEAAPPCLTDKDGVFTTYLHGDDKVPLVALHPEHAMGIAMLSDLEPGKHVKDVTVTLPIPGAIDGVLEIEGGGAVAGEKVHVRFVGEKDGPDLYVLGRSAKVVASIPVRRTDTEGRFKIGGLRPGRYELAVRSPRFPRQEKEVDVIPAKAASVRIALVKPLSLSGRLVDDEGEPVAGVRVSASMRSGDGYGSAASGPDGRFVIENLRAGTYRLRAWSEDGLASDPVEAEAGAEEVKVVVHKR